MTESACYAVDEALLNPKPKTVALVDDVLTTGAHFRAAHNVIKQAFLGIPIVGLFIATGARGRGFRAI
jgi:predicted amidophosphoribosyltransferase